MQRSITFFYPSKRVGGAQYLVLRLAELISGMHNVQVHIIDYEDGFVWNKLKDSPNVSLIKFEKGGKLSIDNHTTLVIFPSYFEKVGKLIDMNTDANLVMWVIHPYLFIGLHKYKEIVKYFIKRRMQKVKRLFLALQDKHALYFMDQENFEVNNNYFHLNSKPEYLPIPTIIKNEHFARKQKESLNIAWMGRVSAIKIESIKYVLNDILKWNKEYEPKIRFHVIGDGENMDDLKAELRNGPETEVIFKGVLLGDDLQKYLFNEIDVMFVMGTSALDCAAYKIPTILLDYSVMNFSKLKYRYKYKWIFESHGYMVGQDIKFYKSDNKYTLGEVVEQVKNDTGNLIGQKCYDYVYNNHNIEFVASRLLKSAKESEFLVKDARNYNIDYGFAIGRLKKLKDRYLNN